MASGIIVCHDDFPSSGKSGELIKIPIVVQTITYIDNISQEFCDANKQITINCAGHTILIAFDFSKIKISQS